MKLLLITREKSDLSKMFFSACECHMISPDITEAEDINEYDSVAVLGGTDDKPIILNAFLRDVLERFADTGKPLFLEYTDSFRCVYSASPVKV